MIEKLFVGDRDIPYASTKIPPLKTKADIDGILARWGITKVMWEFDLEHDFVKLRFELPPEKFRESTLQPIVALEPPRIWNKKKRGKPDSVNWMVSLRILHWFIKDTLAMAYAMQSQKVVAFLPHIQTHPDKTVKDDILPKLQLLENIPQQEKENLLEAEYSRMEEP